jgi:RNA polymerase sigma factor (sigma-70 family)
MVEMEGVQHIGLAASQNERIEQTVRKDGGRLLNFIKRQVRDDDDARDIFQDVFSQLVETYRGLESIERVTSWLFRVARNKIADLYRRQKPLPASRQQVASEDEGIPSVSWMDILPDFGANPEELLHNTSIWEAIEAALDELPETQRDVFVWHEFDGLSFREISEQTGETENTLRMRKYHAVQSLRERLAAYYMDI